MPPPPKPQMKLGVPGHSVTQGPIHRVPCPHCGQPMDFRGDVDAEAGGVGWGDLLETGSKADCDSCGRTSKVLTKDKIIVVKLLAL